MYKENMTPAGRRSDIVMGAKTAQPSQTLWMGEEEGNVIILPTCMKEDLRIMHILVRHWIRQQLARLANLVWSSPWCGMVYVLPYRNGRRWRQLNHPNFFWDEGGTSSLTLPTCMKEDLAKRIMRIMVALDKTTIVHTLLKAGSPQWNGVVPPCRNGRRRR